MFLAVEERTPAARERNEENTKRDGGREGWPEHPQGSIIREIGFGIFQIPSPTGKHRRRSVVSRVCLVGNVFSSLREVSALQSNYTVFAGRFSQKGEGEREREKGIEKPTPKSRSVDAYRRRVSGKLSAHPVSKYQDKRTFSRKFEGDNERKVRKSGEDKKPSRVIFRASLRLRHFETIPHFADSASRLTSTPWRARALVLAKFRSDNVARCIIYPSAVVAIIHSSLSRGVPFPLGIETNSYLLSQPKAETALTRTIFLATAPSRRRGAAVYDFAGTIVMGVASSANSRRNQKRHERGGGGGETCSGRKRRENISHTVAVERDKSCLSLFVSR